ncbi:MAG TPA: SGNH/GDSL hydrolase family protein [Candidatus Acidoferrum sp.]|nr:SGNH/GDSL hydrolase family protein [Candidatus Acidoferrum sp.]
MYRCLPLTLFIGLLMCAPSRAQLVEDYRPPRSSCCLAHDAKTLSDQMQDWNQLSRYHAADEELKKQPADPKRVVFMGDSITDFWKLEKSFPGKPYLNRGIGGQTTQQMLVRMFPDVIDLKPAAIIILAGTNDIAQNTGPETATMVEENLMAMTELAQKHGIKVILCSVTPISDYTIMPPDWDPPPPAGTHPKLVQSVQRPPAQILQLNIWMKSYAASVGAVYADYFSAVVDGSGMLKEGLSNDGLHPNAQGYALMVPVAEAAIEKALK